MVIFLLLLTLFSSQLLSSQSRERLEAQATASYKKLDVLESEKFRVERQLDDIAQIEHTILLAKTGLKSAQAAREWALQNNDVNLEAGVQIMRCEYVLAEFKKDQKAQQLVAQKPELEKVLEELEAAIPTAKNEYDASHAALEKKIAVERYTNDGKKIGIILPISATTLSGATAYALTNQRIQKRNRARLSKRTNDRKVLIGALERKARNEAHLQAVLSGFPYQTSPFATNEQLDVDHGSYTLIDAKATTNPFSLLQG
jgi:hypothetical protein